MMTMTMKLFGTRYVGFGNALCAGASTHDSPHRVTTVAMAALLGWECEAWMTSMTAALLYQLRLPGAVLYVCWCGL